VDIKDFLEAVKPADREVQQALNQYIVEEVCSSLCISIAELT
jgi:hypothetical protein